MPVPAHAPLGCDGGCWWLTGALAKGGVGDPFRPMDAEDPSKRSGVKSVKAFTEGGVKWPGFCAVKEYRGY